MISRLVLCLAVPFVTLLLGCQKPPAAPDPNAALSMRDKIVGTLQISNFELQTQVKAFGNYSFDVQFTRSGGDQNFFSRKIELVTAVMRPEFVNYGNLPNNPNGFGMVWKQYPDSTSTRVTELTPTAGNPSVFKPHDANGQLFSPSIPGDIVRSATAFDSPSVNNNAVGVLFILRAHMIPQDAFYTDDRNPYVDSVRQKSILATRWMRYGKPATDDAPDLSVERQRAIDNWRPNISPQLSLMDAIGK